MTGGRDLTELATETEPAFTVAGVDLADVVRRDGPFATLFLAPGDSAKQRAQIAVDRARIPPPFSGLLIDAVSHEPSHSQVIIVDAGDDVSTFLLDDPFSIDLARFGDAPSIGPLVEAKQMTVTHVVVTVDQDAFGVTNFGAVDDDKVNAVYEAFDLLVAALRDVDPSLIALVGAEPETDKIATRLQSEMPAAAVTSYATDDIDADLMSIADEIVRDAASLAAERRTLELAHFREARSAGSAVENGQVLEALRAGRAVRLLAHDDVTEALEIDGSRAVDLALVAAVRNGVPITMIPDVDTDRGPAGGLGAVIDATVVAGNSL